MSKSNGGKNGGKTYKVVSSDACGDCPACGQPAQSYTLLAFDYCFDSCADCAPEAAQDAALDALEAGAEPTPATPSPKRPKAAQAAPASDLAGPWASTGCSLVTAVPASPPRAATADDLGGLSDEAAATLAAAGAADSEFLGGLSDTDARLTVPALWAITRWDLPGAVHLELRLIETTLNLVEGTAGLPIYAAAIRLAATSPEFATAAPLLAAA